VAIIVLKKRENENKLFLDPSKKSLERKKNKTRTDPKKNPA